MNCSSASQLWLLADRPRQDCGCSFHSTHHEQSHEVQAQYDTWFHPHPQGNPHNGLGVCIVNDRGLKPSMVHIAAATFVILSATVATQLSRDEQLTAFDILDNRQ